MTSSKGIKKKDTEKSWVGWIALFDEETSVARNFGVFIRIKERGGVTAYAEPWCTAGKQSSGCK